MRVIRTSDSQPTTTAALNLADLAAEARAVVLDARKQASQIILQAREEAARIESTAIEAGRRQGLELGRREGRSEGLRQAAEQADAAAACDATEAASLARRLAEELTTYRQELQEQARREALVLAVEIARKIVGRLACDDLSAARASLAKVLSRSASDSIVRIRVNPAQLEALRGQLPEVVEACGAASVELVADETISPGGAKLVSPNGQVDATIHAQLDAVVEALLGPQDKAHVTHGIA